MHSEYDTSDPTGRPDGGAPMPGLEIRRDAQCCRILIFPNRSMSGFGWWVAVGACLSALLPATLLCLLLGAWPLLPFLGLELVVIVGAFVSLARHRHDYEELVLDAERVELHRRDGRRCESQRFARYWVRLVVEPAMSRYRPDRLWLRSHGRQVELARGAGAATRERLAHTLRHEFAIATGH
jgi:uncharacterized membrane protein